MESHVQEATSPHTTENTLNQSFQDGLQFQNISSGGLWLVLVNYFLCIGLHHLYPPEQGIGQTMQLLKYACSASKLGSLLQIGLNYTQLHDGVSYPILEHT
jgi:hypothetical protein